MPNFLMHVCRPNQLDEVPKLPTFSAIRKRHQGGELSRRSHHTPLFDDVLVLSYLTFLDFCQCNVVHVDIDVKPIAVVVTWNWVGMRKIKGVWDLLGRSRVGKKRKAEFPGFWLIVNFGFYTHFYFIDLLTILMHLLSKIELKDSHIILIFGSVPEGLTSNLP